MTRAPPSHRVRVLIVDDSALVRNILRRGLGADPGIEVVGTADQPYAARDLLVRLRPDVMTLDVEMPMMDGVTFLRKVMARLPTPTVIVSSLTERGGGLALSALEAGAVDVVAKPKSGLTTALPAMMSELISRVKMAAAANVTVHAPRRSQAEQLSLGVTTDAVIGLGASTGGVAALSRILPMFPADAPGIVLVQHMPPGFTSGFAARLDETCAMRVKEAKPGDRVLRGHVLVAPGGERHLCVRRIGGEYRVELVPDGDGGHVPSVDVFLRSLANAAGPNAAACLLTGMGRDGAAGLLELRLHGGRTFAQDEASSAVWGMPGAAVSIGAAESAVSLGDVPATLMRALQSRRVSEAPPHRSVRAAR